ncbi:MAG: hypothetical protein AAF570_01305 [Bacteroidota bacterium]
MTKLTFRLMVFASAWLVFAGCDTTGQTSTEPNTLPVSPTAVQTAPESTTRWNPGDFDRSKIKAQLKAKIDKGEPLVAHILVPLCDNDHQGIVPVNSSLGNGQNTRTNLYWGAGYGIKTHFKRASDWTFVGEEVPAEKHLLDRAVFKKKFSNGTTVILVADAYDGAHMEACLNDFLGALAGKKQATKTIDGQELALYGKADLVGFNGHNGLMDMTVPEPANADSRQKDAVVIACASHGYFADPLANAGGYPLVCTTHLLAPEAYVMRAILDAWGAGEPASEVRLAAGRAYHKYQKCGLKGATNLFKTGW